MNDLLDSLLDRTVKNGPDIRPRLASAYELAGERIDRGAHVLTGADELETLEVFAATDTPPRLPAQQFVSTPKSDSIDTRPEQIEETAPESSLRVQAAKPAAEVPVEVHEIREIVSKITQPQVANRLESTLDRLREQPVAAATSLLSSTKNAAPTLESQVEAPKQTQPRAEPAEINEERDVQAPVPRAESRPIEARVLKVSLPDGSQKNGALDTTETVREKLRVGETPKPDAIARSTVRPRLEPGVNYPLAPQLKAARTVEHVVNVTIGRIEVRATPQATTPSRTEKPTTTSLDDYLRQRQPAGRGVGV